MSESDFSIGTKICSVGCVLALGVTLPGSLGLGAGWFWFWRLLDLFSLSPTPLVERFKSSFWLLLDLKELNASLLDTPDPSELFLPCLSSVCLFRKFLKLFIYQPLRNRSTLHAISTLVIQFQSKSQISRCPLGYAANRLSPKIVGQNTFPTHSQLTEASNNEVSQHHGSCLDTLTHPPKISRTETISTALLTTVVLDLPILVANFCTSRILYQDLIWTREIQFSISVSEGSETRFYSKPGLQVWSNRR